MCRCVRNPVRGAYRGVVGGCHPAAAICSCRVVSLFRVQPRAEPCARGDHSPIVARVVLRPPAGVFSGPSRRLADSVAVRHPVRGTNRVRGRARSAAFNGWRPRRTGACLPSTACGADTPAVVQHLCVVVVWRCCVSAPLLSASLMAGVSLPRGPGAPHCVCIRDTPSPRSAPGCPRGALGFGCRLPSPAFLRTDPTLPPDPPPLKFRVVCRNPVPFPNPTESKAA